MTVAELLKMSQTELDDLFTRSPAGEIPKGEAKGTATVAPGTTYTQDIASFINHFAWQGKVFDPKKGVLRNRITPFGLNAIIAKVYKGESWMDGKECIVLDYSETMMRAGSLMPVLPAWPRRKRAFAWSARPSVHLAPWMPGSSSSVLLISM